MTARSTVGSFELVFTPRFPVFFILGALALSVAGNTTSNLLSAYFVEPLAAGKIGALWLILVCSILALAALVLVAKVSGAVQAIRQRQRVQPTLGEPIAFEVSRRGVILTLSLRTLESDSVVHQVMQRMKPEYVGFLGTAETEKLEISAKLTKHYGLKPENVMTQVFEPAKIREGAAKTGLVIDWMLSKHLLPADIALDLTGGTATMSVAAFIAAEARQVDCQYIHSQFDPVKRQAVPGTQEALLITNYSKSAVTPVTAQLPTMQPEAEPVRIVVKTLQDVPESGQIINTNSAKKE